MTHANCSIEHFGVAGAWPIGIGHPCVGCTEEQIAFKVAMHETVDIERPTPPDTYPGITMDQNKVNPVATGLGGAAIGAALGAGWVASKKAGERAVEEEGESS